MKEIENFFNPTSIAIIGASSKKGDIGNVILENLVYGSIKNAQKRIKNGFKGKIYPIEPKVDEILGFKTYKSISDVQEPIDIAVLSIDPSDIVPTVEACGKAGVRSIVAITAGFSETKEDVELIEKQIIPLAKKYKLRVLGPNCFGIINPYNNLNISIGNVVPEKGPIAFMSQSSTLCTSVLHYSFEEFLGFSNFISIGNKTDVDDAAILEYFHNDPHTKCIMLYIESLKDKHGFFKTAHTVARDKPIVAFKSGYSEDGVRAAHSKNGEVINFDAEYDLALKKAGILRAQTLSELYDASRALGYMPIPKGENIVILTNASGPGVLAADAAYRLGMKFGELDKDTIQILDVLCPPNWYHSDYINIIGDATIERFRDVLKVLMIAKEVDGIILLQSPTIMLNSLNLAYSIVDIYKEKKKPITVSFVGMVNKVSENFLDQNGIPEIEFPERAVFAMHALLERRRFLKKENLV